MTDTIPVINPEEMDTGNCFRMWAGQCVPTEAYVWARSFDAAFEIFVEWLDEKGYSGFFVSHEEFVELLDEASRDHGFDSWADVEAKWIETKRRTGWHNDFLQEHYAIVEQAEADLTLIGHTQLKSGEYIVSYEWGGDEVSDLTVPVALSLEKYLEYMRSDIVSDLEWEHRQIEREYDEPDSEWDVDVRLQVYPNGKWRIRAGQADFDTDHNGYWGAGVLWSDMEASDFEDLADDLISEALDHCDAIRIGLLAIISHLESE